jgi:hypothetical protein
MDRRRLKPVFLDNPVCRSNLDAGLQAPSKVMFDLIRREVGNGSLAERVLEMASGAPVCFVCLFCADRGLGIVLQEKFHPGREL